MGWTELETAYDIRARGYFRGRRLRPDGKHTVVIEAIRDCLSRADAMQLLDAGCGNGI